MKTKWYIRSGSIGLIALALTFAARSAGIGMSSQKVSFAGAFQTEFTAEFDASYVAHINVVGDGAASLLGDATCETTNQVQHPDGTGSATYTLRSPRGSVTIQCAGHPKPSDPVTPDILEIGGTYEVVGGTGLFHHAHGSGTFSVSAKFGMPPTQGIGTFALFGTLELGSSN